MAEKKTKVGIIGCGAISSIYCQILKAQQGVEVKFVADLDMAKAQARAGEYGFQAVTSEQLLADPEIKAVVNLTIPAAHYPVAMAALQAGKSVYNEKPLAVKREEGKEMLKLARSKRLRLGGAPDTFLGAGIQTCRKLIDEGAIGQPVAATAFMMCPGHESWHPSPEFYYKLGGGPMFDMGPYYLTALVNLLGPVASVAGATSMLRKQRTITSQPLSGQVIDVEVPTHVAGLMNFAGGAICTIVMSFDVRAHRHGCIEVYGAEGSMLVPDPNGFGGQVMLFKPGTKEWTEAPLAGFGYAANSRGIGLADMCSAIRHRRPHRANGQLCYHVLDLMHAFHDAADKGKTVRIKSTCERPAPMPVGLADGTID